MILVDSTFLRKKDARGQRKEKRIIWWTRGRIQRLIKAVNLQLPTGDRVQRIACTFSVATVFFIFFLSLFIFFVLGVTGKPHLEEWKWGNWAKQQRGNLAGSGWRGTKVAENPTTTHRDWSPLWTPHPESVPSTWSKWSLRTSEVTQQHHHSLMFSIYQVSLCWFPNTVLDCYQTKKEKRFSSPIQAVCCTFNSRREIHADTALIGFGFDSVEHRYLFFVNKVYPTSIFMLASGLQVQ